MSKSKELDLYLVSVPEGRIERVEAKRVQVMHGALVFANGGQVVRAFAPGTWKTLDKVGS